MTILVCGDAMIDRYLFGDVHRISPEAPVPVALIERIEERAGGAANVVNNVEALGVKCLGLFSVSAAPVVKIRVIGRHQQMLRIDFDSPQNPIDKGNFLGLLPQCSMVIFSDYGKGSLSNVQELISIAKTAGKIVLVDPKGHDYERYRGADLIKPNLDEMKELVGGWNGAAHLAIKAQNLCRELGMGAIMLTRASEGMSLFYPNNAQHHIKANAKEVYDVSGAGDTAIATFAVAVSRGSTWPEAMNYANKAAGIVVGRFGTAVATEKEVFG